ncbi:MAG: hypothetical protein COA44_13610 [Arcobacter sp.]|nr:MAG: hypothetical protein COA44_13610 [Arcobacter sp.]
MKEAVINKLLLSLLLSVCLSAQIKDFNIFATSYHPREIEGITILDVKELSFDSVNKIEFSGISALAYSKEKGLYALSDRGYLFNLDLDIKEKKIQSLKIVDARVLKNKKDKILKHNDAEGMSLNKDGLIISFERDPKVSLFNFQAKKIKNFPLASILKDIKNYQKKNRALEAVVQHNIFGIITLPEGALKHEDKNYHTLYSLHKRWKFKADGKVTSIEIMPDNNLLVLEREFRFLQGHSITLSKVDIMNCDKSLCSKKTLASLKSTKGWALDNFEGMTRLYDNVYLMISDDNANFMQKCLLVLFEVHL